MINKNKNIFGVIGLTTAILGFFIYPLIFSSIAIITSAIAYNNKEKYAKAGLIIGIIGFLFGWVNWILLII